MTLPYSGKPMSISTEVRACDKAFEALYRTDRRETVRYVDVVNYRPLISDQYDRFKIWSGNIAAHRQDRNSLDYRLRDASQLRELVLEYLTEMGEALNDAVEIATGAREPWESFMDQRELQNAVLSTNFTSEMQQILAQVADTITCLMRLSMTIQNPVPHDLIMESSDFDAGIFHDFDIAHVRQKFPQAKDFLVIRLGKAISQRRQCLKQWNARHERLSNVTAIVAYSNNDTRTHATTLQPNVQSRFVEGRILDHNDEDLETRISQTSYASSMQDTSTLRTPSFPKEARYDVPFECMICFRMISMKDSDAWRRHVFRDLHPFVCTFEKCQLPNQLFDSQHRWFEHEVMMHRGPWLCRLGCNRCFFSGSAFAQHMRSFHEEALGDNDPMDLAPSMRSRTELDDLSCPLCDQTCGSARLLRRHLGRHQQQLALFALPLGLDEDDDEDMNDIQDRDDGAGGLEDSNSDESSQGIDDLVATEIQTFDHVAQGAELLTVALDEEQQVSAKILAEIQKNPIRNGSRQQTLSEHEGATVSKKGGNVKEVNVSSKKGPQPRSILVNSYEERVEKAEKEPKEKREELEQEMKKQLERFNFRQEEINYTVSKKLEEQKTSTPIAVIGGHKPTYPIVHKKYVEVAVLNKYGLDWEWSLEHHNHIVIKQELRKSEMDAIFEKSRRYQEGRLAIEDNRGRKRRVSAELGQVSDPSFELDVDASLDGEQQYSSTDMEDASV